MLDVGRLISFLIFYTVGRAPLTADQPVARPLPAHRTAERRNELPQVGFETTILVFERWKTVHALDHAAAVFGWVVDTPA
jgi:hypothetical protein